MNKNKKHRASQLLTREEVLAEQIKEAFEIIPNRGVLPNSYKMPANAIVVKTFAETCDVLGRFSCRDGKDVLGELMIESLTLESDDEFHDGISGIFYFLKMCPPNAEPDVSYTNEQISCVRTWLLRIYERNDLRMYEGDVEEIFDLWNIEFVRHKQYWE